MTTPEPDHDLALALDLADAADAISLPRFLAADLAVTEKPDMTPVSDADLAVERALRSILAERRPGDVVVGEEFGSGRPDARTDAPTGAATNSEAGEGGTVDTEISTGSRLTPVEAAATGRAWVIDPIDGTKNFVRGVPIWATLIALLEDGVPRIGVVSAPALARRWWGAPDLGARTAFLGGEPRECHVSQIADVEHASLSLASMHAWEADGLGTQMDSYSRRFWRMRGYGDFYSYMLVAEGAVDVAAEPELSLWDLAALAPIVGGAGGRITTVDGAPINAKATSALATNGFLHAESLSGLAREIRHT